MKILFAHKKILLFEYGFPRACVWVLSLRLFSPKSSHSPAHFFYFWFMTMLNDGAVKTKAIFLFERTNWWWDLELSEVVEEFHMRRELGNRSWKRRAVCETRHRIYGDSQNAELMISYQKDGKWIWIFWIILKWDKPAPVRLILPNFISCISEISNCVGECVECAFLYRMKWWENVQLTYMR